LIPYLDAPKVDAAGIDTEGAGGDSRTCEGHGAYLRPPFRPWPVKVKNDVPTYGAARLRRENCRQTHALTWSERHRKDDAADAEPCS